MKHDSSPVASSMPRRRALLALLAASTGPMAIGQASAAETRRLVLGFPAGPFDTMCRRLAESMSAQTGVATIVENRVGAAGRLAVDAVKAAPPDGSTLLVTPASVLTLYPHLYRQLSYDPFVDLAPVRLIAQTTFALVVGPLVPESVDSLPSFAAWCRAHAAAAQCGNSGAGSLPHFLALLVAQDLKVPLSHVPFRGSGPAMQAVAGGQVAMALGTEAAALTLARAGRVRVVATTGPTRSEQLAEVATFGEAGLSRLVRQEWFGVFVASATPAAVQAETSRLLEGALGDLDVRGVISRAGFRPESGTSASLASALKDEYEFWGPVVRASGFTPES